VEHELIQLLSSRRSKTQIDELRTPWTRRRSHRGGPRHRSPSADSGRQIRLSGEWAWALKSGDDELNQPNSDSGCDDSAIP